IEGDLTSLTGTKLHIPIGGIAKVTRENYISFVNRKNNSYQESEDYKKRLLKTSGIKMKLNLFLTPVAYNEIIFDQKSGDIIRGTGKGKITLEIDTKGDFNMYGDYVFNEGRYNFTMLNVINKDFDIKPGSRIAWIGDPYGGRLDVKAIYEQQASLMPIVGQNSVNSGKDSFLLKRRYPSIVNLHLTGDLKSPDVALGIDIKQTPPDLNIYVQDFKNKLATNEQELNRQVFSLVMLGKFSEESTLSGGSLLSSSLGEFFSNELTKWMNQVDEDLQVDIDLNAVGADGLNALKVRLSRAFLDNRLRISVEDGFANTGKNNPNASAAGLAGNWTVEYMILKNGVIRTKIYNRTTQVANVTNNTITNTSVGVSILHTKDFDRFIELLNLKTKEENEDKESKSKKDTSAIKPEEEIVD
ncbi:MAG TPA: translocation/assembly module TamB domain-containing protein, partial [Cytophagales bacterium]|nr:translocation/assembly module TamB domain-containing protein [Cytophagales bacterium]